MNENIAVRFLGDDKSVSLCGIEPFYNALNRERLFVRIRRIVIIVRCAKPLVHTVPGTPVAP
jgi:hypothetical protein